MEDVLLDEDFGLPDEDHLDMVLEGAQDTLLAVEGTESLALTDAQQYLYTCLGLHGQVDRNASVTGVEGFFSGVAGSLKKVWDYIVKMFKAITDFFFGGGKAEKQEKEAKETIKAVENALDKVGKGSSGEDNFEQVANEVLTALRAAEGEDKKEADQAVLRLEHIKDPAEKAREAEEIRIKLLPKINSRAKVAIKKLAEQGEAAAQAFSDKVSEDHSKTFEGTPFAKMYAQYHKSITDTNAKDRGFLTKTASLVHNLDDGKRALHTLNDILGGYIADRLIINQYKSGIESEIKQIEARMNDAGRTGKIPKELKQELRVCGEFLKVLNSTTGNLEAAYRRIIAMAKTIGTLFAIKV